jgi:hypothetical protein
MDFAADLFTAQIIVQEDKSSDSNFFVSPSQEDSISNRSCNLIL